jgi:hypothetical protein
MLGALLAGASSGCLLYTDHINHPPTVEITGPRSAVFGETAPFHAKAADPDQAPESLSFEWHRGGQATPCPATLAEATAGSIVGYAPDLEVSASLADSVCVWVIVRDGDQAAAFAAQSLDITHPNPEAALEVIKPSPTGDDHYPLFSTIQISSEHSVDGEMSDAPLARKFTLTHAGQVSTPLPCPDGPDTDVCITGNELGDYVVDLAVEDTRHHRATATRKVIIDPDAPPCITQTMPQAGLPKLVRDPNDLTLEVDAVEDDGDPYPFVAGRPQNLRFEWSWWLEGSTGQHGVRPDHRHPQADFNGDFHPGDQVFIRLTVTDRVNRDADLHGCDPDALTCAIGPRKDCFQWVTWKFDLRLGREM